MNALLKKEIRLLLPSFGVALALILSATLIRPFNGLFPLLFLFCPAMVVMMSLDSFGREITSGTFSNLLAQPISRSRIWRTKTLILGAALALILAAWWFSFLVHAPMGTMDDHEFRDFFTGTILAVLAAYSGGLWTVLLFRQVAAAFWFTLLMPGALGMTIVTLLENHPETMRPVLIVAFTLYSVVGFLWARWMFLRAQDVPFVGGHITLPAWFRIPRPLVITGVKRGSRPLDALLAKEFQLHYSQLVMAGVLALAHLSVIALRKFGGNLAETHPLLDILCSAFCYLWLFMPLLVGCAAVAEERKLGTLEGQLCLPARRRTQFLMKFAVVLFLSVLLGAVIPLLLEGTKVLPDVHSMFADLVAPGGMFIDTVRMVLEAIDAMLPFLTLVGIAATIATISFYASTLVRNTLQALTTAVSGNIATWVLLFGAFYTGAFFTSPFSRGWLVILIGVPVMTLALAALAYGNYQRVLVGWSVWRRNALVLLASLTGVIAVTTAIYHRPWELLTPLEPAHGAPRLQPSQTVALRGDFGNRLTIQLPDGRIWINWTLTGMPGSGRFLEGTNWVNVTSCLQDAVGIQKNGSLWVTETPKSYRQPPQLVRLGQDNDWKAVARSPDFFGVFLLKTDGTLWHLGSIRFDWKNPWLGIHTFTPQHLGTDSDWAEISSEEVRIIFRKTDGRAWVTGSFSSLHSVNESILLDNKVSLKRAPYLDQNRWRSLVWGYSPRIPGFQVGVRDDGTFRVSSAYQLPPGQTDGQWELASVNVQLGQDSDWRAVAGNNSEAVTLKADGSLWKWKFPDNPATKPSTATATQLGTHQDWLAIAGHQGGVVSLAADGSLWLWQFEPGYRSGNTFSSPLLAVSRKPQLIGNIFDAPSQ